MDDLFQCDYSGPGLAGVDEVGRGPLAGDVVAAAVILDPARPIAGLRDSKKLSESRREELALLIMERALACEAAGLENAGITISDGASVSAGFGLNVFANSDGLVMDTEVSFGN